MKIDESGRLSVFRPVDQLQNDISPAVLSKYRTGSWGSVIGGLMPVTWCFIEDIAF